MNKKGFTLMEIIVVIALLGAIMLLVVPNITKNFKDSKKRLFYDNVVSLYTSAGRSFLLLDNPSNKTFSNSGNTLDVDVSEDITYKIVVNSYGEVTSMYVTNGTYSYSKSNSNGIKKKDIKLDDIIEGTGGEDASAKVTLFDKLLEDNPTIQTRSSFNTVFTTTNTGTLYKATESIAGSAAKDVYYFAGDAKNNWVKFANFYWRIIRTNADGSIRLLYSGTSPDTTEGYIGTSTFNTTSNSPKYAGYMYGDTDATLEEARTNTNNSTIKTAIDNWYENNLTSYTNYLSNDAIYCNDRELVGGINAYYNSDKGNFEFMSYQRLYVSNNDTSARPTYDCTNTKDAFSVNNTETKLTYPIGLMTADEISYAGGLAYTDLTSPYAWYYLNSAGGSITGTELWWSLSPGIWRDNRAYLSRVAGSDNPGYLYLGNVGNSHGVRPVISLKSCIKYSTGNGSAENPYEIEMNGGC